MYEEKVNVLIDPRLCVQEAGSVLSLKDCRQRKYRQDKLEKLPDLQVSSFFFEVFVVTITKNMFHVDPLAYAYTSSKLQSSFKPPLTYANIMLSSYIFLLSI